MNLVRDGYQMRRYTNHGDFVSWADKEHSNAVRQIEINIKALGTVDEEFGDIDLAFSLYRVPDGTEYDEFPYPDEWMQTCGRDGRLTVETKRLESDGAHRVYTIGRSSAASESETEIVYNGDNEYVVRPSEVLTPAEAIDLFQHYYDHHDVAPGWNLREQPEFTDAG